MSEHDQHCERGEEVRDCSCNLRRWLLALVRVRQEQGKRIRSNEAATFLGIKEHRLLDLAEQLDLDVRTAPEIRAHIHWDGSFRLEDLTHPSPWRPACLCETESLA